MEAFSSSSGNSDPSDLSERFGWQDYLVFSVMLAASAAVGVFYACLGRRKKENTEDFLMAGRQMTTLPVALSLIAR